jgi:hypothetical protein
VACCGDHAWAHYGSACDPGRICNNSVWGGAFARFRQQPHCTVRAPNVHQNRTAQDTCQFLGRRLRDSVNDRSVQLEPQLCLKTAHDSGQFLGVFARFRQRPHCAFRAPNVHQNKTAQDSGPCVGAFARFRQRPHRTVLASAPNVPKTGTGLRLICCWVFVRFRQRPHGDRIEYSQEKLAGATLASKGWGTASRGRQGTTQATQRRLPAAEACTP